ncbi:hypothetical protein [Hyphococcus sp.]|jgi:hypothetical protein|uniref:hypothetical protein n=1 Tax=Hyphococcus sp. TaxID=2038636 RepID=UPI003D13BEBF
MSPSAAAAMMRGLAAFFFVAALVFASGAFPGFDTLSIMMHDVVDYPLDGTTGPYTEDARWFSAIGGGVFASLCVVMWLIFAPAIENGDRRIVRSAIISLLVWFVIDSAGSIGAGVPVNVAFNALFLAMLMAPLTLVCQPSGVGVARAA